MPPPDHPDPPPFDALQLSAAALQVVRELGYDRPTPIQVRALPVLLRGDDLVGQSATGSGKTVAFGLPLLERLDLDDRRVQALVLCPTRELAAQVGATLRTLGRHRAGLRVLVVAGGLPSGPQRKALDAGVHVVVGTPGRVLDLADRGALVLEAVRVAVLDEADRMLDMGFQPDVEQILGHLPEDRQTALFSATIPDAIAAMSKRWQRSPTRVTVAEAPGDQPLIRQVAYAVAPDDRLAALNAVLQSGAVPAAGSVLVFCNFKASVRAVATALGQAGLAADALHGDLEQRDRERVLAKFRNGSTHILVATDVAARGLDIAGIDAVVHYELPPAPEVYVHRTGRTGRAGAPGLAVALVTPADQERLRDGVAATGGKVQGLPLPKAVARTATATPAGMVTLLVRGGRKDKLRPGDVVGALTGEGGLTAAQVGRIEIHDDFAYVAVAQGVAAQVVKVGRLRIKGKAFRVEGAK